jgi:2-oxoisovalerate dehydrogenase E1 component
MRAPAAGLEREEASLPTKDAVPEGLPGIEKALLIRAVEQRLLALFSEGKVFGTVHTCLGQEWTGVAIAQELRAGDVVFSNHRCHGHFLAWTDDVEGLFAEIMGKTTGVCGGRGGSQHLCTENFYSNGIQGGIVPVAAGIALALRSRGNGNIAVAFIGDGTLGEGALYEGLNLAAKWELPLLVVLENNRYAQSTAQEQTLAGEICARAEAFGIEALRADTWDVPQLLDRAREAVQRVRQGVGPVFLQIDTDRLAAHSKGDDDRDPKLIQAFRARDVLSKWERSHTAVARQIQERIGQRVEHAVARAERASYAALPAAAQGPLADTKWQKTEVRGTDSVVNRIHASLAANMERDERIVLLGEDIEGPYGGAFKVTKNLSLRFPGRARNTPISEAAIVGVGNGLALRGLRPVCEIMFGDFLTLAADQIINHAAKFSFMYNEKVSVPVVIRTPMGGKRGYGPTHSQSLEKHFLGLPGTQVLALHHRFDPAEVYDTLLRTVDRPSLVLENKLLYGTQVSAKSPPGFVLEHTDELFPTTRLRPLGAASVTVVCYGGMLADVEKAVDRLFEEHDVICEVICPTRLYPLNLGPIAESVRRTMRLLAVEEGHGFGGFGGEVIAGAHEHAPGLLKRSKRLHAPEAPIPACKPLELSVLPGEKHVIQAVLELVHDA